MCKTNYEEMLFIFHEIILYSIVYMWFSLHLRPKTSQARYQTSHSRCWACESWTESSQHGGKPGGNCSVWILRNNLSAKQQLASPGRQPQVLRSRCSKRLQWRSGQSVRDLWSIILFISLSILENKQGLPPWGRAVSWSLNGVAPIVTLICYRINASLSCSTLFSGIDMI